MPPQSTPNTYQSPKTTNWPMIILGILGVIIVVGIFFVIAVNKDVIKSDLSRKDVSERGSSVLDPYLKNYDEVAVDCFDSEKGTFVPCEEIGNDDEENVVEGGNNVGEENIASREEQDNQNSNNDNAIRATVLFDGKEQVFLLGEKKMLMADNAIYGIILGEPQRKFYNVTFHSIFDVKSDQDAKFVLFEIDGGATAPMYISMTSTPQQRPSITLLRVDGVRIRTKDFPPRNENLGTGCSVAWQSPRVAGQPPTFDSTTCCSGLEMQSNTAVRSNNWYIIGMPLCLPPCPAGTYHQIDGSCGSISSVTGTVGGDPFATLPPITNISIAAPAFSGVQQYRISSSALRSGYNAAFLDATNPYRQGTGGQLTSITPDGSSGLVAVYLENSSIWGVRVVDPATYKTSPWYVFNLPIITGAPTINTLDSTWVDLKVSKFDTSTSRWENFTDGPIAATAGDLISLEWTSANLVPSLTWNTGDPRSSLTGIYCRIFMNGDSLANGIYAVAPPTQTTPLPVTEATGAKAFYIIACGAPGGGTVTDSITLNADTYINFLINGKETGFFSEEIVNGVDDFVLSLNSGGVLSGTICSLVVSQAYGLNTGKLILGGNFSIQPNGNKTFSPDSQYYPAKRMTDGAYNFAATRYKVSCGSFNSSVVVSSW